MPTSNAKFERIMALVRPLVAVFVVLGLGWQIAHVFVVVHPAHRDLSAAQLRYAHHDCAKEHGAYLGAFIDHGPAVFEPGQPVRPRIVVHCAFGTGVTSSEITWLSTDTDVPSQR